ncbi:MAG: T9SS type A sorting domain-containing protein [Cecembia sp.]
MFKGKAIALFFITWALLTCAQQASGQFQQLPTPIPPSKEKTLNARMTESVLQLPFWDDFSSSEVNPEKWINEGATQSFTVGNAAPTLGVLLLDGVDERGRPYSNVSVEQGITDQITSQVIDLSGLDESERNTVFLSFFWQAGGKAELPDFNDNLSLFFLDTALTWIQVWRVSGELEAEQFFFTPEIVPVTDEFLHENFQFRFQINGRASGPFDAWLLDYVYLNKNRNVNNLFFPDRALTQTNTRPLGKFGAVPLFELKNKNSSIWTNTSNEFKNLENRFRAMEYSIELRNSADNSLIKRINDNTPFNPVPLANERRNFASNNFGTIDLPDEETDLELLTYISSGDRFLYQLIDGDSVIFDQVDLRVNDTVRTIIPIRDFYAYDDGKVDYSAGINQRNGMLANRFELENPAYVKGISINFTNFLQSNTFIDLMVWNNLTNEPLFVKEVFIPEKDALEEFAYFELEENVRVEGNFFVGFTQFTNDFVYVGLDKTFDNGSEIFFNVTGSWQQNTIVEGSLMIRVHLSQEPLIGEEEQPESSIRIFPNPVTDWLTIEGEIESYQIFDNFGRSLDLPEENPDPKGKMINFAGLQKGIYLVQVIQRGEQKSFRILVK